MARGGEMELNKYMKSKRGLTVIYYIDEGN
jgi:hypothetical protein